MDLPGKSAALYRPRKSPIHSQPHRDRYHLKLTLTVKLYLNAIIEYLETQTRSILLPWGIVAKRFSVPHLSLFDPGLCQIILTLLVLTQNNY